MPGVVINGTWIDLGSGSVGSTGPPGEDGQDGAPGADGSRIFTGAGAPQASAAPGDIYIDTETGDLWTFA